MDFKGFKLEVGAELKFGTFSFAPGESDKIKKLISFAGSMAGLEFLPGEIKDPPFIIAFSEDGDCLLMRAEKPTHYVRFGFHQVDDALQAVDTLVNVSIDEHTLRPKPRSVGAFSTSTPDTFDGLS